MAPRTDPLLILAEAEEALRAALRLLALADPQCQTGPRGWIHTVANECSEAIEDAKATPETTHAAQAKT